MSSREELAAYVLRLQAAIAGGVEAENDTLGRFLEALAAKINAQLTSSGEASWWYFAYALSAALIYE